MKFARYLQDTQTPEWKKAYIDYRGLKKSITAIQKEYEGLSSDLSSEPEDLDGNAPAAKITKDISGEPGLEESITRAPGLVDDAQPSQEPKPRRSWITTNIRRGLGFKDGRDVETVEEKPEDENVAIDESTQRLPESKPEGERENRDHRATGSSEFMSQKKPSAITGGHKPSIEEASTLQSQSATLSLERSSPQPIERASKTTGVGQRPTVVYPKSLASFRRQGTGALSLRQGTNTPRPTNPLERLSLSELLIQLNPTERAFFVALDAQLDKIDSFYAAREKEMLTRTKMLQEQLEELADHKKLIQSTHPLSRTSGLVVNVKEKIRSLQTSHSAEANAGNIKPPDNSKSVVNEDGGLDVDVERKEVEEEERSPGRRIVLSSDPEDYISAKKKIKKAVLEHYRGLEVLENYRILNLTGFRKVLKKFEKITKIPAQQQYMHEKVEMTTFASGKTVQEMMHAMEALYASRFARGDKKRAVKRLRAGFRFRSHHYSVFRSGILLGLALPAFVSGLYASFQQSTRDNIPAWGALLFIYGIMLIPVLFSLLVGANLLVWAGARINYVFIFELDTRTRLDYREYYEIPSILLAGLCYAFWLSFQRIGSSHISPQIWPLVWLSFCGLLMFEPLPFYYKSSRYWLLKNVGKLLLSGTRRVEFTDFWMGDQLCSLVFTLSNFYFFACVYARGFDEDWNKCGVSGSPQWPAIFILASLPLLCRLVQSVKRYYDSGLVTHLVNGGKYGSGIISNLFFYIWRYRGSQDRDSIFALWILFNSVYSIYASTWDLLMDWSVLRSRAGYPFLREELIYTNSIPLYYFAIITNVLIRFIWVIYIPNEGPSMYLRTFIGALLEIFRRWQWNFYRLENEHLGNMDQYRVTREVPLPYSFDDARVEDADDNDDDDDDQALKIAVARTKESHLRSRKIPTRQNTKKVVR